MQPPRNKWKYLVLDTNIISRIELIPEKMGGQPNQLSSQLITHIDHILRQNEGWRIAFSALSLLELMERPGFSQSYKEELEIARKLQKIKKCKVSNKVINVAMRLSAFYKADEISIPNDQINIGDKIIAATVISQAIENGDSALYTTNQRDFPPPFFVEVPAYRKTFEYTTKKGPATLSIYIMKPDFDAINKYYAIWSKNDEEKAELWINSQKQLPFLDALKGPQDSMMITENSSS